MQFQVGYLKNTIPFHEGKMHTSFQEKRYSRRVTPFCLRNCFAKQAREGSINWISVAPSEVRAVLLSAIQIVVSHDFGTQPWGEHQTEGQANPDTTAAAEEKKNSADVPPTTSAGLKRSSVVPDHATAMIVGDPTERAALLCSCLEVLSRMLVENRVDPTLFAMCCIIAKETVIHLLDILRSDRNRAQRGLSISNVLEQSSYAHAVSAQHERTFPRLAPAAHQASLIPLRTKSGIRDCVIELLKTVGGYLLLRYSGTVIAEHETGAISQSLSNPLNGLQSSLLLDSELLGRNREDVCGGEEAASDWDDWDDDEVDGAHAGMDASRENASSGGADATRNVFFTALYSTCKLLSAADLFLLELEESQAFEPETTRRDNGSTRACNSQREVCGEGTDIVPVTILSSMPEPYRGVLAAAWRHASEITDYTEEVPQVLLQ